jgi:hypothetical protein
MFLEARRATAAEEEEEDGDDDRVAFMEDEGDAFDLLVLPAATDAEDGD